MDLTKYNTNRYPSRHEDEGDDEGGNDSHEDGQNGNDQHDCKSGFYCQTMGIVFEVDSAEVAVIVERCAGPGSWRLAGAV